MVSIIYIMFLAKKNYMVSVEPIVFNCYIKYYSTKTQPAWVWRSKWLYNMATSPTQAY